MTFQSFVVLHLVNETSAIPKQIPTFPSQNIQYLQRKTTMFCFVFKKSWELFSSNSRTVTTRIQEPLWLRTGQAKITSPFYKTLFNLTSCTESYLAKKCKEFLKSYILILTRNISNLSLFQSLQYKEKKKHTLLKIKYDIVFLPKEGTRPILFFFLIKKKKHFFKLTILSN